MKKFAICLILLISSFVFSGCDIINDVFPSKTSDVTTVQAEESVDELSLINDISKDIMKANVFIITHAMRKGVLGQPVLAQGSGVIYKEDDLFYYVLTNRHVIEVDGEDDFIYTFKVLDSYGNESAATLVYSSVVANYDLAVLKFIKGEKALTVIEFDDEEVKKDDTVYAIGAPLGQYNSLTVGKVLNPSGVTPTNSNIPPSAILKHTAPINQGNSGGMLISVNKKLIGLNTWSISGTNGYSGATPLSVIKLFLEDMTLDEGE